MLTSRDILSTLTAAKPMLAKKYFVKNLALFGSYSRNDATPTSDIDIMVEFEQPIGIEFVDLADELEALLHNKVDLVSMKGIKPKYFNAIQPDLIYV